MDFTYFIAGFIALIIGLTAGAVFIAFKGKSKRRLFAAASAVAFALDWVLLINWAHIADAPAVILLFDLLFFAIYSIIGCVIGALPTLLIRYLWRNRPGQGPRDLISN
ncbi:MAG: hypothetical protein ABIU18_05745 [Novosphingobium sp.]